MSESHTVWHRPTAVAGSFYPRDKAILLDMLQLFCENGDTPKRSVKAIMAPHAGYVYSGMIAGQVYRRIHIPKKVFLLCPNHTGKGSRISVWKEGEWDTPIGPVPVDSQLAQEFLEHLGDTKGDRSAHQFEHANEVHLPFLKFLQPDIQMVPITLGSMSVERCLDIGKALASIIKAHACEDILMIASTDMSHYISATDAMEKDKPALESVERLSAEKLYRVVMEDDISMCGFIATTAVVAAASLLGATQGEILSYGNSGDTTRDFERVVAYASAWMY